ncbi:RDD family protein [Motiliproteus sp. MSK22-1]|uniref:RDD family protein n=1 Tax=Motiliproteus sp. MSK22-1 TaxID=1897630 RepID=UPI0009784FD1|nr:RDD family protein [Motiliproteus sp. MSK22-1]OMH39021.1 hypothetical protein BGP75_04695 [Motiliproteus sp. MSK22-1]
MLDTRIQLEAPEGVSFTLSPAGIPVRAAAFAIDLAIRLVIMIICGYVTSVLGEVGSGLLLLIWFLLEWWYPVLFEVFFQGATPGKKAMGLRVTFDDGTPVDFGASLTRNLIRAVDFLPFLYGLGMFSMLVNKDSKRLGDLVAGTLVIHQFRNKHQEIELGDALPSPFPLSIEEQRLLIAFVERKDQLSEERQQELAAILRPLLESSNQQRNEVEYLSSIAYGVLAQR